MHHKSKLLLLCGMVHASTTSITPPLAQAVGHALMRISSVNALADSNVTLRDVQIIDNIRLVDGNRVLLIAQVNPTENGIWVMHAGNWKRPTNFAAKTATSTIVLVKSGNSYKHTQWLCTKAPNASIGTHALTFKKYNPAHTRTRSALGAYTPPLYRRICTCTAPKNSITTAMLKNYAVTNAKIAGSAVTNSKLGSSAVSTSKIASGAITSAKLDDDIAIDGTLTVASTGLKVTPTLATLDTTNSQDDQTINIGTTPPGTSGITKTINIATGRGTTDTSGTNVYILSDSQTQGTNILQMGNTSKCNTYLQGSFIRMQSDGDLEIASDTSMGIDAYTLSGDSTIDIGSTVVPSTGTKTINIANGGYTSATSNVVNIATGALQASGGTKQVNIVTGASTNGTSQINLMTGVTGGTNGIAIGTTNTDAAVNTVISAVTGTAGTAAGLTFNIGGTYFRWSNSGAGLNKTPKITDGTGADATHAYVLSWV